MISGPTQGRIVNPTTAAELLAVPLVRPLTQGDRDPTSMPVLLVRRLGLKSVSGTLQVHMEGALSGSVPIVQGLAQLGKAEYGAFVRTIASPSGSYRLDLKPPMVGKGTRYSMRRIVFEGLRHLTRSFDMEEIVESLGQRMEFAPQIIPGLEQRVAKLGLLGPEERLIKFNFDGKRSARELVDKSGAGRRTTLKLLLALSAYGWLEWTPVAAGTAQSLAAQLAGRADQMEKANHFDALGVHWSASTAEIQAIYKRLSAELRSGGEAFQAAPVACKRMRARANEAYEVLRRPQERLRYQREIYPDHDYAAIKKLLYQQEQSLTMQGNEREADRVRRITSEVQSVRLDALKGDKGTFE